MEQFFSNVLNFIADYGGVISAIVTPIFYVLIRKWFMKLSTKELIPKEMKEHIDGMQYTLEQLTNILAVHSDNMQIPETQKLYIKSCIAEVKLKGKSEMLKKQDELEQQIETLNKALAETQYTLKATATKASSIAKDVKKKFDM